jgi:hypothetical protein
MHAVTEKMYSGLESPVKYLYCSFSLTAVDGCGANIPGYQKPLKK